MGGKEIATGTGRVILIVDDEEEISNLLRYNLEKEGYIVRTAAGGLEALETACQSPPDLVILDIMLPEMSGLDVCRHLRSFKQTALVPILMLSARKEELDKVLGLEMGADDYVAKPFSIREIIARVRALLRREDRQLLAGDSETSVPATRLLRSGKIALCPESYQLQVDGKPCALTHKEFELLHLLMTNAGKVLSRDQLLEKVWGFDVEVDTRTVDVHIRYLRQKIEAEPAAPKYIETVRGVGYRFNKLPDG